MARRKVLVLENELLLSAGLRTLLSRQEDLELLSMKFTSQSKMLQTVDSFRPDVIIMDEEWDWRNSAKSYESSSEIKCRCRPLGRYPY
jgi:DNA-binding NarL/FixJ family response regulator